jgi:hypothetical protein
LDPSLGAPRVGRKDRRRQADAARISGGSLAIAHTWLAHGNRTNPGHHLALRQIAVTNNPAVTLAGLQISLSTEEIGDFGLDGLRQQRMRSVAQNIGELIVECSWLNQLGDAIVRHGTSLLQWRSGGAKHSRDMPPYRFTPSPTFGHSSWGGAGLFNRSQQAAPDRRRPTCNRRCQVTCRQMTGKSIACFGSMPTSIRVEPFSIVFLVHHVCR